MKADKKSLIGFGPTAALSRDVKSYPNENTIYPLRRYLATGIYIHRHPRTYALYHRVNVALRFPSTFAEEAAIAAAASRYPISNSHLTATRIYTRRHSNAPQTNSKPNFANLVKSDFTLRILHFEIHYARSMHNGSNQCEYE